MIDLLLQSYMYLAGPGDLGALDFGISWLGSCLWCMVVCDV